MFKSITALFRSSFYLLFFLTVILIWPSISPAGSFCVVPQVGETKKKSPQTDQGEISRGNCQLFRIEGKLRNETVDLSLDLSVGSGFHFNKIDGPTEIELSDDEVMICSDSGSCGSASIIVAQNGESIEIGSVRSSAGEWVDISNQLTGECPFKGPATRTITNPYTYPAYELERGKYKIYEKTDYTTYTSGSFYTKISTCEEYNCDGKDYWDRCATDLDNCNPTMGCKRCIEENELNYPNCRQEYCRYVRTTAYGDLWEFYTIARCVEDFRYYEFRCQP